MNERIQELAEQAGFENGHQDRNGNSLSGELEKFAELIVVECIEQVRQVQSQTVINGSEEYNTGRAMGIEVCMNQIKQHFGVER